MRHPTNADLWLLNLTNGDYILWYKLSIPDLDPSAAQRSPTSRSTKAQRFARRHRYEPPSEFPLTSPFSGIVHHLSGPNRCAHTQTSLNRSVGCWCKYPSSHFHCASRFTHPGTCTYVRLLGPCFKTGRVKPFCHHIHVKGCNSDQTSPEHEAREEMSPEAMLQDTQYSVQR